LLLGLANSFVSLGNYVCMIPELATRQAQGIIIGEALLIRLVCPFQFGTTFLLSCICHRFEITDIIWYSSLIVKSG